MRTRRINVNRLSDAILSELDDYETLIKYNSDKALSQLAEDTAEKVAQAWRSSGAPSAPTSEYGNSFSVTRKEQKNGKVIYRVGSSHWYAHLLEHGHALIRGGRLVGKTGGFSHFEKGEDFVKANIEKRIRAAIEK